MAKKINATDSAVYAQNVGITYIHQSPDGDIIPYSIHTSMEHFKNVYNHVHSLSDLLEHYQPTWYSIIKEGLAAGNTDSVELSDSAVQYLMTDEIVDAGLKEFGDKGMGVGYFVVLGQEYCSKPSATATIFSDWLKINKQMLIKKEDSEIQFYENDIKIIQSPESKLKEDSGQKVNWVAVYALIYDEEHEVHRRIIKCSRDMLEFLIYNKEFTPEDQEMLSLTSKTMILEVLKDESEPAPEMDIHVMLMQHLALQPQTKLFLEANRDCDINFQISINCYMGDSTQVNGLRTDDPIISSLY